MTHYMILALAMVGFLTVLFMASIAMSFLLVWTTCQSLNDYQTDYYDQGFDAGHESRRGTDAEDGWMI